MNSSEIQPPVSDRIRIGECIVTLSSREVEVVGARRPRRLTPKALGVLRVLLRQPGRVVTRDELFAEVWPDTLPTNDVLTQAVTQLRKAFSNDDDSGQAYIETIAKTGYRLLVPVQALDDAEPSAAGLPDDEDDFNFAERVRTLTAQLEEQMVEGAALDQRIRRNLAKVEVMGK